MLIVLAPPPRSSFKAWDHIANGNSAPIGFVCALSASLAVGDFPCEELLDGGMVFLQISKYAKRIDPERRRTGNEICRHVLCDGNRSASAHYAIAADGAP